MLQQITYETARIMMRPGDGIGMGAQGGFVSEAIKFFTRSTLSHWAQVFTASAELSTWLVDQGYLDAPRRDRKGDRLILIESTIMTGRNGVQVNWASDRINDYHGRVYWLPLNPYRRSLLVKDKYEAFGLKCLGLPYDKVLIAHDAFDLFHIIPSRENWESFICSEFGAAILKVSGALPANLNTSDQTPQSMAEAKIWNSDYFQVSGCKKEIRNFNTKEMK
jgi:hypothetical protein